jgi:hypothetical protein
MVFNSQKENLKKVKKQKKQQLKQQRQQFLKEQIEAEQWFFSLSEDDKKRITDSFHPYIKSLFLISRNKRARISYMCIGGLLVFSFVCLMASSLFAIFCGMLSMGINALLLRFVTSRMQTDLIFVDPLSAHIIVGTYSLFVRSTSSLSTLRELSSEDESGASSDNEDGSI